MHCFFEQSGTFKNEFKKLGIEAYDYDIQNEFGETDFIIDLFTEIKAGYENKPSVFDNITSDELIFAFFPCTYFECQSQMYYSGHAYGMNKYSTRKRVLIAKERHKQLSIFYEKLCELVLLCDERGIPLIIENPRNQPHYLTMYWCEEPTIIDMDRTLDGDYYKKPTQYWFFNCKPKNNLVFEAIDYVETTKVEKGIKREGMSQQTARSMIHPQYANRFIRKYIIEQETDFMKIWGITE